MNVPIFQRLKHLSDNRMGSRALARALNPVPEVGTFACLISSDWTRSDGVRLLLVMPARLRCWYRWHGGIKGKVFWPSIF